MSRANQVFYGVALAGALVVTSVGLAAARVLLPLAPDGGSMVQAFLHWCHLRLTGSPETDDLVLVALLGLLPSSVALGLLSIGQQWRATRGLVRARTANRLLRPPRRVARLEKRLGLQGRLDVVRAVEPYSFCYGLVRPRVCLSTGLARRLSDAELEAVLLHERYHLRSRDPVKVLMVRTIGRGLFFVPVVAELGQHFLVAKEVAADREVVRLQGHSRWIASALYKLIASPATSPAQGAIASLLGTTEARIDHLLDPTIKERVELSARGLAASGLLVVLVTSVLLSPDLVGAGSHIHAVLEGPLDSGPL